jgi:hypothetical protein
MGHTEQMKITKMPLMLESFKVYKAKGIQANGLMGFNT